MIKLLVKPEAEADFREAYEWYEKQREGLGVEFTAAVDHAFEQILERMDSFPVIHNGVRRYLLRKFPYAIYFVAENGRAIIAAIFHCKRDPAKWRARF